MRLSAWIRHVNPCWFLGLAICSSSSDYLKVSAHRQETHSFHLAQGITNQQEASFHYIFPVSGHRHCINSHFFFSMWNNQTSITKLRLRTVVSSQPPCLTFPLLFFPLFHGLFFPTWETRRMCIPGKARREGRSHGTDTSKEPFVLRAHYSWNPIKCPKTRPSFSDSTETSHAGLLGFAFLKLYRVHWIIWLGLFNCVTFEFSMAQMELIINYLDALIKKKHPTSLWIYEGLLGGKDKEAFSDSLIWMRVRVGKV